MADIIRGIRQTEKGTRVASKGQYIFDVSTAANKIQIKDAVETLYRVTVTKVNTQTTMGKWHRLTGRWGKRSDWKKAIVTLAKGQKIEAAS
jgi:large subunit ribosomal protein L23